MKKQCVACAVAMAIVSCQLDHAALADGRMDPTQDLTKIYAKLDDAADHKNIDACMAPLSSDFMLLNTNGTVQDINGQRQHLADVFVHFDQVDVTTKILHCDFTDKTATVEITQHVKVTTPSSMDAKPITLEGDLSARELWSKGPTGWTMDLAQTLANGQLTPDS